MAAKADMKKLAFDTLLSANKEELSLHRQMCVLKVTHPGGFPYCHGGTVWHCLCGVCLAMLDRLHRMCKPNDYNLCKLVLCKRL